MQTNSEQLRMNTNLAHFDLDGALIVDTVAMMQTEGFQKQMEALDRCFKAREILEDIKKETRA